MAGRARDCLPNTVTSFVPSAPLAGMNAGITPKNAWLGTDLEHRSERLLRAPGREFRQGRLHRVDEVVHRQEMAHVGFGEEQHGGSSGVIISSLLAQGSGLGDRGSSKIFA